MKGSFFLTTIALLLTAGLCACNKSTIVSRTKPVITITEPAPNDTSSIAMEDSVHIMAGIIDSTGLHDVIVNITDSAGRNVFTDSQSVSTKAYTYHEHFHPDTVTRLLSYTLKVAASNHNGDTSSQTVRFYVKP